MGLRTTSRRRRWTALAGALVMTGGVAVTTMLPADAVHEVGVFELDTPSANATSQAAAGDDWDVVCHSADLADTSAAYSCTSSGTATNATAVAWTEESNLNSTIFTGGGSKDPQPIENWLWKDGAGGLPDKDNLLHAFAARYSVTNTDPTPGTDPSDDGNCAAPAGQNCDVLYFGMDRYDNAGDAQLGFWFFKNRVAADGAPSGGGNKFTGTHAEGDLLVLSDFSNGGTTSTIKVFKWVNSGGDVSEHLLSLGGGDNKNCDTVSTTDSFCGVVSTDATTDAPWSFTDKKGSSDFAPGELYEGGINLSDPSINLGGECFASFGVESRSSTSPTATLKDFVLGQFGSCSSSISSAQSWTPSDSATVSVTGKSTWSGTVQFKLFGNGNCAAGTNQPLYTSDSISVSNSDATATTGDSTGKPSAVSASGTYSWQVFFDSATSGVPDQTSCLEATTLSIDNDTSTP